MDIKILFSISASAIGILAFLPYIRDIFRRKTKPHIYTWFIVTLVQGMAAVAILQGGGKWGALWLCVNAIFNLFIFLLCFRYGTKDITLFDTLVSLGTLATILLWWQLHNPYLAIVIASAIDFFAQVPTMRKTYFDPWSETISLYICFIISNFLTIAAAKEYNFLTVYYLSVMTLANVIIIFICLTRRPKKYIY